eukprot:10846145-Lingulodinium_polyedra.AAC.1
MRWRSSSTVKHVGQSMAFCTTGWLPQLAQCVGCVNRSGGRGRGASVGGGGSGCRGMGAGG